MKSKQLIILAFLLITIDSIAQIKLSALFSDHMVLQRNSLIDIWGTDKPNTKIIVKPDWGEKVTTTSDNEGKWKLQLKTNNAGGPYALSIIGSSKVIINDVLLGEVWICSGQSNMERTFRGNGKGEYVSESNKIVSQSTNPALRMFKVKNNFSPTPLDTCIGKWQQSTPEVTLNFSAVAYSYGKMLQETLGVPVGLILSSVGGTPAEAWTSKKTLNEGFPVFNSKINKTSNYTRSTPTALYNAMIHPLIPFAIKGVIWYQGETNRKNPEQYAKLLPALIKSWREDWGLGEFPFYFVQIAPFEYGETNSAFLREAQLKTMLSTPNTGMAVTLDIGDEFCIHPPIKKEVGERLGYWALAKTYGMKGIQFSGPVYKSMMIQKDSVYLNFDDASDGLCSFDKQLKDFTIAGSDKIFRKANATINKGRLVVWSDSVVSPIAVRYAWKNYVQGSLYNVAGLPASSFRTDDWNE